MSNGYETFYTFKSFADGSSPDGDLIAINDVLYGTTSRGGANGYGTVFKITASGTEAVLYSFKGGADGANPGAGLTNVSGTLYGTTANGGVSSCYPSEHGCGTIFKITTSGQESELYAFKGSSADGAFPGGKLRYLNGVLYGTTVLGGRSSHGTAFGITTSGAETMLYSFVYDSRRNHQWDGALPHGGLTALNGTLYGATGAGGGFACGGMGCGTTFEITPTGTETVLHRFQGSPGGDDPTGILLADNDTLFGTTQLGGAARDGSVFKLMTPSDETRALYSFQGPPNDGAYPLGHLNSVNGTLYGTTYSGGNGHCLNGCGTIFKVTKSGTESVLHSFGIAPDGFNPVAGLIEMKGALYGVASGGGENGDGTVFRISP